MYETKWVKGKIFAKKAREDENFTLKQFGNWWRGIGLHLICQQNLGKNMGLGAAGVMPAVEAIFPVIFKATFAQKRFWLKMQTFLYRCTFCVHENSESATNKTQAKCSVNAENVFYQACCMRKSRCGLGKPLPIDNNFRLLWRLCIHLLRLNVVQTRHHSTQTRCLSSSLVASCSIESTCVEIIQQFVITTY